MRKIYNIKVNGKVYEVELEEVSEVDGHIERGIQEDAKNKQQKPKNSSICEDVKAPMPGMIIDIKVSVGDVISKGDVVAILEAMKMETEILAPINGRVSVISKSKGDQVALNDLILSIN